MEILFWWDVSFNHTWKHIKRNYIIVESNDSKHPLVAIFEAKDWFCDVQILKAQSLIEQLKSGELDYKKLADGFTEDFVKSFFPNFKAPK